MRDMMTVREAAFRWGISERRISKLCTEGRIPGAYKEDRRWLLPLGTKKPDDNRIKSGAYVLRDQSLSYRVTAEKLPLPIGVSDYKKACSQYYYVDKTRMIKDFLDETPSVSLFTRPRRFGKTLNMNMLRVFFEKSEEDTAVYFRDKKIWSFGEKYQRHQGQYPVIYLTFKDIKFVSWENTLQALTMVLRSEFDRHRVLLESERCSMLEKERFREILEGRASDVELMQSLALLSGMLDDHYGIAPVLMIDEYDVPIHQGYMNGFYEEVIVFMRGLFSGALKDNSHLSFGFLTGILRVAKESIFSGMNNLKVDTVLDNRYGQYFGFTAEEVQAMMAYYGAGSYEEIRSWYDGYQFGDQEIFNPWSVIGYFNNFCKPKTFWVSTSSNDIIGEILSSATPQLIKQLSDLLRGGTVLTEIDTGVIYPQIKKNPASVYSFLLSTGYLKVVSWDEEFDGSYKCEVAIPNREIRSVYNKEILTVMEDALPQANTMEIQQALYTGDGQVLQRELQLLLMRTVSFHDTATEGFYHGLMLGLCALLDHHYWIHSNRESGIGRYDIQLTPKRREKGLPGILIELKAAERCNTETLRKLAQEALSQITAKCYDAELQSKGVAQILKYGAAFSGKAVEVACEYII